MKVLKMFGCIGASILICIGILLYSLKTSTETIAIDMVLNEVIDQIGQSAISATSQVLENVLPEDWQEQVSEKLPSAIQEKVNEMKEEISKDEQIHALSQKYMDALLASAIDDTADLPDVSEDVKRVIEEKLPEVAQLSGNDMSVAQASRIADEIIEKTQLQERLESGMEHIHQTLTPSQKQLVSYLRMLQQGAVQWVAYGMIAFGLIAIAMLTFSPVKWMLYGGVSSLVAGASLFAGGKLIQLLSDHKQSQLGTIFEKAIASLCSAISTHGILFLGIGLALLILYALITFVKNHIVYE